MNFKISKNGIEESFWNSTEKITTPSLAVSKNGSKYYIPLFEGNTGNEVTYSDYIYTLGKFSVGSKHAVVSRADVIPVINNFSIDAQRVSSPYGNPTEKIFYGYKLNISFSNDVTDFKFSSYGNEIDTGVSSSIKPNFYYVHNYSDSIIHQDEWISINSFDPRNNIIWVNSEISQDAVFVLSVRNSIGRESQAYINFRIAPEVEIVQISDGRIYAFVRSCTKEELYLDYGQGAADSPSLVNRFYLGHDDLLSRQEPFEIGTRYQWNSEDLQYKYPQFDDYPANITIFENMSEYPGKINTDGHIWVYAFPKGKSQCGGIKVIKVNLALCDSYYS